MIRQSFDVGGFGRDRQGLAAICAGSTVDLRADRTADRIHHRLGFGWGKTFQPLPKLLILLPLKASLLLDFLKIR